MLLLSTSAFVSGGACCQTGLEYVSSWVDHNLEHCYQLMETDDPALIDRWIACWSDLADFEVNPVITSQEAAEKVSRLSV